MRGPAAFKGCQSQQAASDRPRLQHAERPPGRIRSTGDRPPSPSRTLSLFPMRQSPPSRLHRPRRPVERVQTRGSKELVEITFQTGDPLQQTADAVILPAAPADGDL